MKSILKNRRISLLAAILAVTLIRPPAPASSQSATDIELERFFDSDYTWCDVQLLSSYWQQDVVEAKARVGRKIGWGDEQYIEQYLDGARQQAGEQGERCDYHENGFTYEDAERLSAIWQMPIDEVKTVVEDKLFYGNAAAVYAALEDGTDEGETIDAEAIDTFWSKGYTYCDARLVAAHWQEEVLETKQLLGAKLMAGNYEGVDWQFEAAREELDGGNLQEFSCDYWDEGYTYEDMEALAGFWGMSVGDTKGTVENKLVWGLNDDIQAALAEIRG